MYVPLANEFRSPSTKNEENNPWLKVNWTKWICKIVMRHRMKFNGMRARARLTDSFIAKFEWIPLFFNPCEIWIHMKNHKQKHEIISHSTSTRTRTDRERERYAHFAGKSYSQQLIKSSWNEPNRTEPSHTTQQSNPGIDWVQKCVRCHVIDSKNQNSCKPHCTLYPKIMVTMPSALPSSSSPPLLLLLPPLNKTV